MTGPIAAEVRDTRGTFHEYLDYVALDEIAHFVVPHHSERFRTLLDSNMPGSRNLRDRLNERPLEEID